MIQTKIIRQFRRDFDLSQPELAKLLQTTRSQVSQVELGQRPMPIDAEIKLLELIHHMKISKVQNINAAPEDYNCDPALQLLQKKIKDRQAFVSVEMSRVDTRLNKMAKEHQSILETNRKLSELIAVLPDGSENARALDYKRRLKIKRLRFCNQAALFRLRIKKDLLSAEAKLIAGYIKDETFATK